MKKKNALTVLNFSQKLVQSWLVISCEYVMDFNSVNEKIQQNFLVVFKFLSMKLVHYVTMVTYVEHLLWLHYSYVNISRWFAVWFQCVYINYSTLNFVSHDCTSIKKRVLCIFKTLN